MDNGIRLGYWFYKHEYVEADKIDYIRYGYEVLMGKVLLTTSMLIYGIVIDELFPSIFYIIVFRRLRSRYDGYHAKTVHGCMLLTMFSYVVCVSLYPRISITTLSLFFIGLLLLHRKNAHISEIMILFSIGSDMVCNTRLLSLFMLIVCVVFVSSKKGG